MEITPIATYIGVVFSFMVSLSLDCYHFDFSMILKETLITFLLRSNPVLQSKTTLTAPTNSSMAATLCAMLRFPTRFQQCVEGDRSYM